MNSESVRELVLLPENVSQTIVEQARIRLNEWAIDWLPGAEDWLPQLVVSAGFNPANLSWLSSQSNLTQQVWASQDDAAPLRLAMQMNGKDSGHGLDDEDWALRAASKAIADLHTRMLGCSTEVTSQPSKPDVRPFAGTLVIHELQLGLYWAWSSASLQALHPFRSSTVASGSAAVTSIAPLLKAIKTKGLCLQASLGEVEISISDLVALRPGDVVRFPASITSGIRLAIEAGSGNQDAVIAQLGQMDGYTAVRVSSLHTAS